MVNKGPARPAPKKSTKPRPSRIKPKVTEDGLWGPGKSVKPDKRYTPARPDKRVVGPINKTVAQAKQAGAAYGAQYKPVKSSKGTPVERAIQRAANAISGKTDAKRYKRSVKRIQGM